MKGGDTLCFAFFVKLLFRVFLIYCIFMAGYLYRGDVDTNWMAEEEIRLLKLYDRNFSGNTIYYHEIRFPKESIKESDTWFQKQHKLLEASWQQYIIDVNFERIQSIQKQSALLRFEYIPWVSDLIQQVTDRNDLLYKEDKLHVLSLRLDSMKALDEYLRNSYDDEPFDIYLEKDTAFRSYIEDNTAILK